MGYSLVWITIRTETNNGLRVHFSIKFEFERGPVDILHSKICDTEINDALSEKQRNCNSDASSHLRSLGTEQDRT